jgi:ankyrin repeat protein
MSLIESAKENNVIELKRLIQRGDNINAADGFGYNALYWAASMGHVECALVLIDAKADVTNSNQDGDTPLHIASFKGHVECVRVGSCCVWGWLVFQKD